MFKELKTAYDLAYRSLTEDWCYPPGLAKINAVWMTFGLHVLGILVSAHPDPIKMKKRSAEYKMQELLK